MQLNRFAAALLGTTALLAAATAAVAQQATTPVQPGINAPAAGAAGLTASGLRDKPVYDAAGQEIGQVASVVVGTDNQSYAVVRGGLFGTRQVLVPVSRLGYQNDRFVAGGYNEEQFRALPVYTAGAADYRDADDTVGLNVTGYTAAAGGTQTAQGGEATNIVVQQAAPAIRVDQVPPQITVQQAQPQVTVRQAQPEILVRQPAPTVTVDIPQPEIIVRMPAPEVAVAQAQPQVQVNQAPPTVQVVPQEQPQVQVQAAQPQVSVQQAVGAQAAVQMEGSNQQPVVRYERAEPRVVVNQQQGEPQVRVEEMQGGQAPIAPAAVEPAAAPIDTAAIPGAAVPPLAPPAASTDTTVAAVPPAAETTGAVTGGGLPLAQLLDMNVVDANGRSLGEVDRIVQGADGRPQAVVGIGGFLGIGERNVALPLENMALYNDRQLVIRDMNDAALRALPAFSDRGASDVARDFTAQIQRFER